MSKIKKAYMAALLQIFIIGFSFLFIKIALRTSTPAQLLSFRFFFAFIAVLIPVVSGRMSLNIGIRDFFIIAPVAVFYPILFFGTQAFGLVYTTSVEAGLISSVVPVFTMIMAAVFLKEKTTLFQKAMIFLSVTGIMYMTVRGASDISFNLKGTVFLVISSISSAAYMVLIRVYTKKYRFLDLTFVIVTIGFVFFTAYMLIFDRSGNLTAGIIENFKSAGFITAALYLGVLSTFGTSLLNNYALSEIEASKVGVLTNLTPVIAMIAGFVILGERVYSYEITGIIVTITGVIGASIPKISGKK